MVQFVSNCTIQIYMSYSPRKMKGMVNTAMLSSHHPKNLFYKEI